MEYPQGLTLRNYPTTTWKEMEVERKATKKKSVNFSLRKFGVAGLHR